MESDTPEWLTNENLTLIVQKYLKSDRFQILNHQGPISQKHKFALSTFHASSLVLEEKLSNRLEKTYRLIEEYPQEFEESYFNDKDDYACKHHIDACFRGVLKEIDLFEFPEKLLSGKDFKTVLEGVLHNVYQSVKPSQTHRNVVCHGDLWATNFLVKYDSQGTPVACKFVDFQYGRYCPPAQDVLALLYLTTSREFRHKHMYNLLGLYYNNLEKCLAVSGYKLSDIIPFSDFLTSCEEQKQFALVQTATYFPLVLIDEDVNVKYFSDEELYHKYLVEDRSLLVRDNMVNDGNYKRRVYDSVLDLKEYCDRL